MVNEIGRRLAALPPTLADLAIALALMACADLVALQVGTASLEHVAILAIVMLPLSVRRRWPTVVTWVVGGALLLNLGAGFADSFFETFAILLAAYTMYAQAAVHWPLAVTTLIVFVGLNASFLIDWHNKGTVTWTDLPYNYLIFGVSVALGYSTRLRHAHIAQLEERNRLLAREAALEERNRIARELHDVVAHGVGVMVLQATAGSRVAGRDPARAAAALDVIQDTGRQALDSLRRVVGVLRTDTDAELELQPQPGLDQLEVLVEEVRRAGIPVELRVEGERRRLPQGVELSAYRVVQESLTNVLKHARATSAQVTVDFGASQLGLEIQDDGDGGGDGASGGHGVAGMRERVQLYGGELRAGRGERGFRVSAHIPLRPAYG
jgi:signal transduction histidine kinase